MELSAGAFDFLQDVGSLRGPDKGFWLGVVLVDVVTYGHDQLLDIAENSTAKAVLREVAKESLHHVEPGTAGRCEVDVEPRMAGQPLFQLGMFVGRVVIGDEVNLLFFRSDIVD